MVELISANPKYNPKIVLTCDVLKGEELCFYGNRGWLELSASYWLSGRHKGPFYFGGNLNISKKLIVYNSSEEFEIEHHTGGFAMKKEICEDGSIIYYCNGYDYENKKSFDEIIFKLTILKK